MGARGDDTDRDGAAGAPLLLSHVGTADGKLLDGGDPPGAGPLADCVDWLLAQEGVKQLQVGLLDDGLFARRGGVAAFVARLGQLGEGRGKAVDVQVRELSSDQRRNIRALIDAQATLARRLLGKARAERPLFLNFSSGMPTMQTALVFLRLLHHPRARLLQGAPGGTIEALEFPATLQEIAIRETARRAGEVTILVRESTYGTFRTGDPEVARAVERVERYAAADVGVLLHGETGTGKEHLARLYHAAWRAARRRPDAPFEAVNCGLLTPELAAAALFGHAKGAFTGAVQSQEGHFQRASGGVLLLDELGDLPALTQVQVLRALDQGAVRRVGGSRDEPVNVRVVAATSRDLSALRQDLRFRVAGAVIQLPPLRARADLAALAAALLVQEEERLAALQGRQARAVSLAPDGAERLRAHAWPGNVRELRAALVQALVERGDGGALGADDLAPFLGATAPAATIPLGPDDLSFTAFTRAVRLAFVAAVADRLGHGPAAEALRLGGKQAVGNQVKELRSLAEAPGGEWLQNLVDELGGERRTPGRRPGRERP